MHKKRQLTALILALTGALVLTAAPVWAEQDSTSGSSSGSGDTTTTEVSPSGSSDTSSETSHSGSSDSSTDTSAGDHKGAPEAEIETLQAHAKSMLETERQSGKTHSEQERQTACKAHEADITARVGNFSTEAQAQLNAFNKIMTDVQSYVSTNSLAVTNYSTLLAAAQAKQTSASTAVQALASLDVQIDCTQPDPAQAVATIKAAVSSARTSLQAYRSALKDLVAAVKTAAQAAEQAKGGNQ